MTHHPDKRKAKGEEVKQEDDYFTCITRAYEILGNPVKRRSYDSVDPEFDDGLPSSSAMDKDYFGTCRRYFEANARWSEKKKVPAFGDNASTRDEVEQFYNFWYNFESWREYSYMDEEDKEKGQDRDERRWIEKQNKTIRAKRKKEEMSRIRSLVDLAYKNDPRIVRFRHEEKDKRNAAKRAKQDAFQAQKAEEERALKEIQMAKLKAEEAEQKRIEAIRIEREQQKKHLKKEKKVLRDYVKSVGYFAEPTSKEFLKNMEGVEKICEMLKLVELQDFNKRMQAAGNGSKNVFQGTLKELDAKIEAERQQMFQTKPQTTSTSSSSVKVVDKSVLWSPENMQLLIKAVNLFPAGTAQRWDVIANFMNQHSKTAAEQKYIARDVLGKAKDLQNNDFSKSSLKSQVNDNAFESFEKQRKELKKVDPEDISVNNEGDSASQQKQQKKRAEEKAAAVNPPPKAPLVNGKATSSEKKPADAPPAASAPTPTLASAPSTTEDPKTWSKEEQALLEQAIKTYPISTPERWDRIAECIPNRTKKDCLRRVKELVDLVNAKKEAQKVK